MEVIKKKICLEDWRSRFNGKFLAIKDGYNIMTKSGITNLSYYYDNYNDYKGFPYDIIMQENSGDTEYDILTLLNKLYPIHKHFPCYVSGDNTVLKYRTLLRDFKVFKDMLYDKVYDLDDYTYVNTLKYYELCKRNGEYTWVEITDEMWDVYLESGSTNQYYDENMREPFKKFFFFEKMGLFSELPPEEFYWVENIEDKSIEYFTYNPDGYSYYCYVDISGNTKCVSDSDNIPSYYAYVKENGTTAFTESLTETGKYFNWEKKSYNYVESAYTINKINYADYRNFNFENDTIVICVSPNMNKFIKIFCDDDDCEYLESPKYSEETIEISGNTADISEFGNSFISNEDGHTYIVTTKLDRTRYEYYMLKLINILMYGENIDSDLLTKVFSEPFIGIDLLLTEEMNNIGISNGYCEEWIPNKKYYIGDIVVYNNESYKLREYDTEQEYIDNGYGIDTFEVSRDMYNDKEVSLLGWRLIEDNGICYLKVPYYKGFYNRRKRITFFDDFTTTYANGDFLHWVRAFTGVKDTDYTGGDPSLDTTKGDPSLNDMASAICESKLYTLKRYKKAYDDNGNELPFIFTYDENGNSYADTELVYRVGIQNTLTYNDTIFCDILTDVIFSDENGNIKKAFSYTDSGNTRTSINVNEIPELSGIVEFDYIIRARVDDEEIDDESGIKYVDKYYYTISTISENVKDYCGSGFTWNRIDVDDGDEYSGKTENEFKNIEKKSENVGSTYTCTTNLSDDFVSGETYRLESIYNYCIIGESLIKSSYDEEDDSDVEKIYSNLSFNGKIFKYDDFQTVQPFKDESLNGIDFVKKEINVNIERGSYDAVEKHQILSEVNTFEDLENYRNNFFNL